MTLKCLECDKYARWHVYYTHDGDFAGYNSFCDEHMIGDVRNGRQGWHVVCAKLVADQFLPDDDRVKEGAQNDN